MAEGNRFIGPSGDRGRGRDASALQRDMVAKASRVLEHAVEPDGDLVVQGVIDSGAKPPVAEHASLNRDLLRRIRFRNLGYAVNDAAGAAASEDHPVRTLQGF